ncbi:16S rRNA (uracil1498-N3)-methyltransferase [Bradyrhizobium sp. LM6.9]
MPSHDFRGPRLFVDAPLAQDGRVELDRDQANYLGNVLRLAAGAEVLAFNGRDGEWQAAIEGRKRPDGLVILQQTRPQDRLPDLTYVFAPLKHARLDYMVQKAIEMGAATLQPVLTRFTQASRVNTERMRANVVEAAEQCGILSIATVAEPAPLERFLSQRAAGRLLIFCDEAAELENPIRSLQGAREAGHDQGRDGIDVLIGPRGRLCRGRAGAAAAAAENPAAGAGTPDHAGRHGRGGGAGAGAGGAGRLGWQDGLIPALADR